MLPKVPKMAGEMAIFNTAETVLLARGLINGVLGGTWKKQVACDTIAVHTRDNYFVHIK